MTEKNRQADPRRARLDPDGTAEPKPRLTSQHQSRGPNATTVAIVPGPADTYIAEDGTRIPLNAPRPSDARLMTCTHVAGAKPGPLDICGRPATHYSCINGPQVQERNACDEHACGHDHRTSEASPYREAALEAHAADAVKRHREQRSNEASCGALIHHTSALPCVLPPHVGGVHTDANGESWGPTETPTCKHDMPIGWSCIKCTLEAQAAQRTQEALPVAARIRARMSAEPEFPCVPKAEILAWADELDAQEASVKRYALTCDGCGCLSPVVTDEDDVIDAASDAGWAVDGKNEDGYDTCPECRIKPRANEPCTDKATPSIRQALVEVLAYAELVGSETDEVHQAVVAKAEAALAAHALDYPQITEEAIATLAESHLSCCVEGESREDRLSKIRAALRTVAWGRRSDSATTPTPKGSQR